MVIGVPMHGKLKDKEVDSIYTNSRAEEVILIKKLLAGDRAICPKCKETPLEHFHKKAKKSNTDYYCPSCCERYQVIKMIDAINKQP